MKLLFTLVFAQTLFAVGFSQVVPNFNRKDRETAGLKGPVKSVMNMGYHGDRKTDIVKGPATLYGSVVYVYNASGNYISTSELKVKKQYTYDAKGRLIKLKQTSPKLNENYKDSIVWKDNTEYHYFRNSSWPDKKLVLTRYCMYDSLKRKTREYYVNKEKVHRLQSSYGYTGKNLTEEVFYVSGKMEYKNQWDYNAFDSIVEYRKYISDSVLYYHETYEYNAQKLKTKVFCYGTNNVLARVKEYFYDAGQQVVKISVEDLVHSNGSVHEFAYDANGFMIRESYSLKGGTRRIDKVVTYVNDKYGNPVKIEKFENDIKYMIVELKYTYY